MPQVKRQFYNISREEMEDFLFPQKFRLLNDPADQTRASWSPDLRRTRDGRSVTELVYGFRIQPRSQMLTLRVYSGIWLSGESRDVGADAIRVVLVWMDIDAYKEGRDDYLKLIGSETIVKRTPTWAKNLANRIDRWEDRLGPICPLCGHFLVLRHKTGNKSSKFWGCIGYRHDAPEKGCKYTQPWIKE